MVFIVITIKSPTAASHCVGRDFLEICSGNMKAFALETSILLSAVFRVYYCLQRRDMNVPLT